MREIIKKATSQSINKRAVISLIGAAFLAACGGSLPNLGDLGQGEDKGNVIDLSKPVVVAVLTPDGAGGPLEEIGKSIANGARMAANEKSRGEVLMRYYRTGGNPSQAAEIAKKAVAEGANVIVGPLKSEEIIPVEAVVDVPVLSFSNNSDFADSNTYIFGTTFDNIAERVIDFQKSQGGRNLGVVFENGVSGRTGATAAIKAASNSGVNVVSQQSYNLSQEEINSAAPSIAENLRSSGADMVFFTDNPAGGLSYVAVALRENGFTNENAQYMGLSRWDEFAPQLSHSGLNGGIFAVPDPYATTNFRNSYKAAYGSDPHTLAGLGYDATLAVINLVRDARRTNDSTPFSSSDIQGLSFSGANGAVSIDNHVAKRALAIMQLSGNSARLLSNAPSSM